jgi:hypothetical protein
VCAGRRSRLALATYPAVRHPPLRAIDLLERVGINVEQNLVRGASAELIGEHREVVKQAVPARVHHRQVGRVVIDSPQARLVTMSEQEVRCGRVRVKLHALVGQRGRWNASA